MCDVRQWIWKENKQNKLNMNTKDKKLDQEKFKIIKNSEQGITIYQKFRIYKKKLKKNNLICIKLSWNKITSKLEPRLQTRWLINICIRFFLRRVLQYLDYITNDLLIVIYSKIVKYLLFMLINDHNVILRSFD